MSIKVAICGALGKMGQEVIKAVEEEKDLQLTGLIDKKQFNNYYKNKYITGDNLEEILRKSHADVLVDFTQPDTVMSNIKTAILCGVAPVVGTTGLTTQDLDQIHLLAEEKNVGVIIAPNFAIGAVLMMHCASKISKFMNEVEIIEFHHEQKLDAPSGTAIKTAQLIKKERNLNKEENPARGGIYSGVNIHSVRLPGLVAHQEVIFGGEGQTLTIRHDSTSRRSFMPGVIMAVKEVKRVKGVIYGLENLLGL